MLLRSGTFNAPRLGAYLCVLLVFAMVIITAVYVLGATATP